MRMGWAWVGRRHKNSKVAAFYAQKLNELKEERETVSRDKPEKHVVASHDIPKALNVQYIF